MVKILGHIILSFAITNWIYSELCLLYPPTEQLGNRIVEVVRIPTHDEWPKIANSKEAKVLSKQIDSQVMELTGGQLFDSEVIESWEGRSGSMVRKIFGVKKRGGKHHVYECQNCARVGEASYLSGDQFFVWPTKFERFQGRSFVRIP